MTSSSNLPRAVTIHPASQSNAADWSPDELPRSHAITPAGERTARTASADEARMAAATEDGYARGYEQGFRAGEFAEAARLRSAVTAAEDALAAIEQESSRWVANAEENICALAVTVARHLIGRELATDEAQILATVRLALAEFPMSETLRVRLNPADLHMVTTALAANDRAVGNRAGVRWSADPRMAPGGCLVEGHERIVDGRIDVGLERLYRRLSNAGS